jgi:tRNA(fMet)-specific endonuclease VapC
MVVLDSSVLVAVERGNLDLRTAPGTESTAISAVTASELLHRVHRAGTSVHRAVREAFVERLLSTVPILPFDLTAARIHARLWAELAAEGITVGAHDLLIAATALANGGVVATRDERSFPRIPGVRVLRW